MALDSAFYLVSEDIARRCGLIGQRYRVGNRYILDNKDLSRIRFTSEEFLNGLQGIEKISNDEAKRLVAQSGYNMSGTNSGVSSQVAETEEPAQETTDEPQDEAPAAEDEQPEEPAEESADEGGDNENEQKEEEE